VCSSDLIFFAGSSGFLLALLILTLVMIRKPAAA
jgi:hypothetical protein